MNREEFASQLRAFDWYYAYSDDHSVWSAGHRKSADLRQVSIELDCPYDMHKLRMWAHKMIIEEFKEEEPGQWYRQPHVSKYVAPTYRKELITMDEWYRIDAWLSAEGKEEENA